MTETIFTPDQRLRVFVSSTMSELAAERAAARDGITSMHLHPVLFELGARPHPPRELYRAYLDQSQIFIGIYHQSYGWIAPDGSVSGIEDEYQLAGEMPRLIYIKEPAPEREARLRDLLARISEGGVSYKRFRTPEDLRALIVDDLALMLTERFSSPRDDGLRFSIPALANEFIDRESEVAVLERLLSSDARVITLYGPAGVGKSRLALEVAWRLQGRFEDGAHLVMLEAVKDPALLLPTIATSLGISDRGPLPADDLLIKTLRDRDALLVLDNFEQISDAAPQLSDLAAHCPKVRFLVTSRALLKVRGEQVVSVDPLSVPDEGEASMTAVMETPAARLLMARAGARSGSAVTSADVGAIRDISRRLDGLPLALELAASRTRTLGLIGVRDRLSDRFSLLKGGLADAPDRHRTLRGAIEWSVDLLDEQTCRFFMRSAIFSGGWTLDDAVIVAHPMEEDEVLEHLQTLIECSLIKRLDDSLEPRFSMLETVHEVAVQLLRGSGSYDEVAEAHAHRFLDVIDESYVGLRSSEQAAWLDRLQADRANVRTALRWAMDHGEEVRVAEAGWAMWVFWWVRSAIAEGRAFMDEVISTGDRLPPLARARAKAISGAMAFWELDIAAAVPTLSEALEELRALDDDIGVGLCQLGLGVLASAMGMDDDARSRLYEAKDAFAERGDLWGHALALNGICWIGRPLGWDIPRETFEEAVTVAEKLGTTTEIGMARENLAAHLTEVGDPSGPRLLKEALGMLFAHNLGGAVSYTIDAVAALHAEEGEAVLATRLLAAAEAARASSGEPTHPAYINRREQILDRFRKEHPPEAIAQAWEAGTAMSLSEAVELALA